MFLMFHSFSAQIAHFTPPASHPYLPALASAAAWITRELFSSRLTLLSDPSLNEKQLTFSFISVLFVLN